MAEQKLSAQNDDSGMSSVQRQLAEYRATMRNKISSQTQDNSKESLLPSKKSRASSSDDSEGRGASDKEIIEVVEEAKVKEYEAPVLSHSTQLSRIINQSNDLPQVHSKGQQALRQDSDQSMQALGQNGAAAAGSSKLIDERLLLSPEDGVRQSRASIVNLNSIPCINVFNLTRNSDNMLMLRSGRAEKPDDLLSAVLVDDQIRECDLTVIEKEVNKKKQKRFKDVQNGGMISPLATSRQTTEQREQRRNDIMDDMNIQNDIEENMRDQLMVDQIVDDPFAAEMNRQQNRRNISLCCGLFVRRANGHLDILCAKDIDQDFVYMLSFVFGITVCLALFATFAR